MRVWYSAPYKGENRGRLSAVYLQSYCNCPTFSHHASGISTSVTPAPFLNIWSRFKKTTITAMMM